MGYLPISLLLIRSLPWIPEKEYQAVTERFKRFWGESNETQLIPLEDCLSMLDTWEHAPEGRERIVEWFGSFVIPQIYIELENGFGSNRDILDSKYLINLSKIFDWVQKAPHSEKIEPFSVLAPELGERIMQVLESGSVEISFCGNLAADVQKEVHGLSKDEKVLGIFNEIRGLLHYSKVKEASLLVTGLYSVLEKKERTFQDLSITDLEPIFSNIEVRAKMDIIRAKIEAKSDDSIKTFGKTIKEAINYGYLVALSFNERSYFESIYLKLMEVGERAFSLGSIEQVLKVLKEYRGFHRGVFFPVLLALRNECLNQGIRPEMIESGETRNKSMYVLLNLGIETGEIAGENRYVWRRIDEMENKRGVIQHLQNEIRRKYGFLNLSKFYKKSGMTDLQVADENRKFSSRSLLDLIYRLSLI